MIEYPEANLVPPWKFDDGAGEMEQEKNLLAAFTSRGKKAGGEKGARATAPAAFDPYRYLSHQDISLDAPFDGESSRTYADLIPSPAPPLEERLAEEELSRLCGEKFQCFSETIGPRERQILEQRLLAETPMTLREIGEKHGVTRETVRQTEKKLLKKLRTHLAQELPKSPMALWGTFFLEKVKEGKAGA